MPSHWQAHSPSQDFLRQHWLQRPGALTAGLRQLGRVDLRVLREYEDRLPADEATVLHLDEGSAVWVREIVMAIDGSDCVVARSVTPLQASMGSWAAMRTLQTRPLADLLYHDPAITRSHFLMCRLHTDQALYHTVQSALDAHTPPAPDILARCSVFSRNDDPLMVAESFLPGFWAIARFA